MLGLLIFPLIVGLMVATIACLADAALSFEVYEQFGTVEVFRLWRWFIYNGHRGLLYSVIVAIHLAAAVPFSMVLVTCRSEIELLVTAAFFGLLLIGKIIYNSMLAMRYSNMLSGGAQ